MLLSPACLFNFASLGEPKHMFTFAKRHELFKTGSAKFSGFLPNETAERRQDNICLLLHIYWDISSKGNESLSKIKGRYKMCLLYLVAITIGPRKFKLLYHEGNRFFSESNV